VEWRCLQTRRARRKSGQTRGHAGRPMISGNYAATRRGGGAVGCSVRTAPCHSGISSLHESPSFLTSATSVGATNAVRFSTSTARSGCGSLLFARAICLHSEHGCRPSNVFVTAEINCPPCEYATSIRDHATDCSAIQCPPEAANSTKSMSTWPNRSRVGGIRRVLRIARTPVNSLPSTPSPPHPFAWGLASLS